VGRTITLITEPSSQSDRFGALDTGVSHAIALAVGNGRMGETLRIHPTADVVAFGRQDVITPGYPAAVAAARGLGYQAIERLAGGRAAVFHSGTLAFAWTISEPEPRAKVHERFELLAQVMAGAFRDMGLDARIGQVEGEYCPGAYSVNLAGRLKVMGVGQRLVRGAAHVGGVVVVEGSDRLRDVLTPVYDALNLTWRPETAGALADAIPGVDLEAVRRAIVERFGRIAEITHGAVPEDVQAEGRRLAPGHSPS
jgi:lipoate-protein ligase A